MIRLTVANTFDDNGNLKGSQYFANGRIVSEDEYLAILKETNLADEIFEKDEVYENCKSNEECYCLDCTIERYIEAIQNTDGCPNCIKDILYDFVEEIDEFEFEEE